MKQKYSYSNYSKEAEEKAKMDKKRAICDILIGACFATAGFLLVKSVKIEKSKGVRIDVSMSKTELSPYESHDYVDFGCGKIGEMTVSDLGEVGKMLLERFKNLKSTDKILSISGTLNS